MDLALFDFDHTITTRDTYSGFLRRIATPQQLAQARWTVGPWLLGYRAKLISAKSVRARVTQVGFQGRDAAEIAAHGAPYARDTLSQVLRPEMMQQIEWHHAQGHTVALVSASLDLYLQPWCEQHGLELICNRLEHGDDGLLTGRYAERDCGPHKAALIQARYDLPRYQRIHAYGDSHEDKPMLALAHERWYRGVRIA